MLLIGHIFIYHLWQYRNTCNACDEIVFWNPLLGDSDYVLVPGPAFAETIVSINAVLRPERVPC